MTTTDLQKPFTDEELKAWAQNGGSMRSLVAMRLAARVIELEAENKRLREVASRLLKACIARGSFYGSMQSKAYDQMIDELDAAKAQVRAALKGGE